MQRHTRYFGPYAVLEKVGSGGMGTIYRALDTRLQREVALKVLHRNLDVSGARERFRNEARAMSSLNHPNICTVFDIGEQGEDLFLVMEMLAGQCLKERIATGPILSEELRSVALQVARALQAAHARRIVHRDIKPANIFLTSGVPGYCQVKVLDFGLAKCESADKKIRTRGITRHGATVGTVEYMSPEQACGLETDERSDLFSLGAVLYEMATGAAPFRGATSAVIYSELLNKEPQPARDANLDLPQDLDQIIQRLLQKAPADRFQSASELLHELEQQPFQEPCARSINMPEQFPIEVLPDRWQSGQEGLAEADPSRVVLSSTHRVRRRTRKVSRRRLRVRVALLCTLLTLLAATVRIAWAGKSTLQPFRGTLIVTPLQNETGNVALDIAPGRLLQHELASSRSFGVNPPAAIEVPNTGNRGGESGRHTEAVLTGTIVNTAAGYSIHIEVSGTNRHIRLAEADEIAPSLEQVPSAVLRASAAIREELEGPATRIQN